MGPSQIGVLTKAFSVFRRLGLDLWLLLRHHKLFVRAGEIRRELAYAYSDLMQLTCEVNAHYQSKTRGTIYRSLTFMSSVLSLLTHD